jgi:hypothetical protein
LDHDGRFFDLAAWVIGMEDTNAPVICVIPGDLHLTKPGLANHQTALWMVEEVNNLIHYGCAGEDSQPANRVRG